jgi:membrane protease YdiL (CAAX protease family)
MWTSTRAAAHRRPTLAFFAVAFVLTWLVWVPRALVSRGALDAPWVVDLGATWAYGPAEAALIVAALIGRDALRDLGRRLVRWRVPLRWYAVVLLGPAAFWAVVLVVVGVLGLLGIPYDGEAAPQPPLAESGVSALPLLAVVLVTDALGEETGWRGFALPSLLRRLPDVVASTLLGVVWACWHLPLLWTAGATLEGASPWVLLLELPARSVVFTWIFRATGGSAVLAVLLHAAMSVSTLTAAAAVVRDGRVGAVILVLEWLLAVCLVVLGTLPRGRGHGRRDRTAFLTSTPSSNITV